MDESLRTRRDRVEHAVEHAVDRASERVAHTVAEVKPHLRGWLHAGTAPLTLVAGIVLVALSPTATTRVGSALFVASALLVFTVSAIYHRGTWSPRTWAFLRRFDHANIFVLIAGSYTPFALLFLRGTALVTLLVVVWSAALAGVLFRVFWTDAPRWLYTPMYIALGWAALFFIPQFLDGAGRFSTGVAVASLVLVAVGGLLYTLGALVYGLKRPDPSPRWFGFHEVFHAFTVVAFASHYVGVSLVTYSMR
jgi:hemolysin III